MPPARQCPECQTANPADFAFCWTCGLFLLAPPPPLRAATKGRRMGAALLDLAPGFVLLEMFLMSSGLPHLIVGFVGIGYECWTWRLMAQGQSPGKALLGLWVVDPAGQPKRFGLRLVIRTALWWVSAALGTLTTIAGAFSRNPQYTYGLPELNEPYDAAGPMDVAQGQMMHDRIVKTYVVVRGLGERRGV